MSFVITPTGDLEADLLTLYNAMKAAAMSEADLAHNEKLILDADLPNPALKVDKTIDLGENIDLNTVLTTGFYRTHSGVTWGAGWDPYGVMSNSQLIVSRGGDTIIQIISGGYGARLSYMRTGTGVGGTITWTDWAIIWNSLNCPATLAAEGSQTLASGLIIKWGVTASQTTGGPKTLTYPTAFPHATLFAINIPVTNNAVGQTAPVVATISASGFTYYNSTGVSNTFRWLALGY